MNSIIQIFETRDNINTNLIQFVNRPDEIFRFIQFVFKNPVHENIENLNTLYRAINKYNSKILTEITDNNNKTLLEFYKDYSCNDDDLLLKKHIDDYIKSRNFTTSLFSLLANTNKSQKKAPSVFEIVDRLEYLEKTVEELKVRISNENLLTERTTA
jgi:hypothetical protein